MRPGARSSNLDTLTKLKHRIQEQARAVTGAALSRRRRSTVEAWQHSVQRVQHLVDAVARRRLRLQLRQVRGGVDGARLQVRLVQENVTHHLQNTSVVRSCVAA